MSEQTLQKLVRAVDALWGSCDSLHAVCAELIDDTDQRLLDSAECLSQSQDALREVFEEMGLSK